MEAMEAMEAMVQLGALAKIVRRADFVIVIHGDKRSVLGPDMRKAIVDALEDRANCPPRRGSTAVPEGAVRGSPDDDDDLRPITAREASIILNCNIKSVYVGMKRGEIPVITVGRLRFIPRAAFKRLLREGAPAAWIAASTEGKD